MKNKKLMYIIDSRIDATIDCYKKMQEIDKKKNLDLMIEKKKLLDLILEKDLIITNLKSEISNLKKNN